MTTGHPWNAYFPLVGRGQPRPFTLPSPANLDAYETKHHFPLPESYRSYALAFGLGWFSVGDPDESLHEFHIAIPGYHASMPDGDPASMTQWFRDACGPDYAQTYAERYDDGPRATRLVLFTFQTDWGFFGWDPDEVTDPDAHEYAIYRLPRDGRKVARVADTFAAFLLDVVFEGKLDPDDPTPLLIPSAEVAEGDEPELDDFFIKFVSSRG